MKEGTRVVVTWGVLGEVHGTILDRVTDGFDHTVMLDSGYTVGVTASTVRPDEETEMRVRVSSDLLTRAFNVVEDALLEADIHFSIETRQHS